MIPELVFTISGIPTGNLAAFLKVIVVDLW